MYTIEFSKKAVKSLKSVPKDIQLHIKKKLQKLQDSPFDQDLKKITYTKVSHRLRVGDYRIFLKIDSTRKYVIIADIRRRTTQTYR